MRLGDAGAEREHSLESKISYYVVYRGRSGRDARSGGFFECAMKARSGPPDFASDLAPIGARSAIVDSRFWSDGVTVASEQLSGAGPSAISSSASYQISAAIDECKAAAANPLRTGAWFLGGTGLWAKAVRKRRDEGLGSTRSSRALAGIILPPHSSEESPSMPHLAALQRASFPCEGRCGFPPGGIGAAQRISEWIGSGGSGAGASRISAGARDPARNDRHSNNARCRHDGIGAQGSGSAARGRVRAGGRTATHTAGQPALRQCCRPPPR